MTRQRAAAIERAVAAYRRSFRVNLEHTAMEMIADLIGYHQQFVDSEVAVDELLAQASRRASTMGEDERDSEPRNEDVYAPPAAEVIAERDRTLRANLDAILRSATASTVAPPTTSQFWSNFTEGPEVEDGER